MSTLAQIRPAEAPALPSNVEAEAALIGALLYDNSLADRLETPLRPEHFSHALLGRIYAQAIELIERGAQASPVSLKPYFEADPELKELGGLGFLARLAGNAANVLSGAESARQIHELAMLRELAAIGAELRGAAGDMASQPAEVIAAIQARLDAVQDTTATNEIPFLMPWELEDLPQPEPIVRGLIPADAFGALYAEPKALKSFAAIDVALHVAHGLSWAGCAVQRAGVLYIAGEGASGIGPRVMAWHQHHERSNREAAFALVPIAVELMAPGNDRKLARAVERAAAQCGAPVRLIVIDTLSRAIPGQDENATAVMSAIVKACDSVRQRTGATILAVHHAGKDKGKGLRGNSALLGALDFVIRADRSGDHLTLTVEAMKDGEDGGQFHFTAERIETSRGPTLVLVHGDAQPSAVDAITRDQIRKAFDLMEQRWNDGAALSNAPQSRKAGRYAPKILASEIGGDAGAWDELITGWLESRCVSIEVFNNSSKAKGLKVLERLP